MRISILAYGTRGDVQPYLALALALAKAGHQVRLAAPAMFGSMVEQYAPQANPHRKVEFFALPGDPTQLMRLAASPSRLAAVMPAALGSSLTVLKFITPIIPQLIQQTRQASEGADLVIHTLLTTITGHQTARELGIHDLSALVFPVFTPSTQFPNPLFTPWPAWMSVFGSRATAFGPRYHYLTHREFNRVFWYGNRLTIRLLRRRYPGIAALKEWPFENCDGLMPAPDAGDAAEVLYGISRHALPYPNDWPESCQMTGYWFLDAPPAWKPPEGLMRFLDSGPAPVFIGFGSVITPLAERLTHAALDALRQNGQRGVLLQGWGGLKTETLPDWVYPVDQVPYDWLFPRLAAVLHHGGMGTTAAALRAGIPQAAMPFTFDQPFWGRQAHRLGVGPEPIKRGQRNAQAMAKAIASMLSDSTMQRTARQLGEKIRAEDGLGNAVQAVEEFCASRARLPKTAGAE